MCAAMLQFRHLVISPSIALASFASIFLFLLVKSPWVGDVFIYLLTGILIVTIVNSAEGGVLRKFLRSRPLTWLGERSYSIYMSHYGILWVFDVFLRRVMKYPVIELNGRPTVQLPLLEACAACLFAVLIVLIVSDFIYKALERPLREKSRRILVGTVLNPSPS